MSGQGTLEYALVLLAFVSMVAALGLMWHLAEDGRLVSLAVDAASHSLSSGLVVALQDVLAF